jgi:TIGR00266 family protein
MKQEVGEMKYQVIGEPMPVVVCELEGGESMITERGSMCWMSPNMEMQTSAGGFGKAFGRMFSGESMFQNIYTAKGAGMIAFASSFPGSIKAVEITPDRPVVVQKSGFLASESGVELSVFFQKKAGAGFFGGEGFIMQKLSGHGTAFLEVDGYAVEYELQAGQQIVVDTGNLAMIDATCSIDIQTVKGVKNVLFGGEGMFNTVVSGPGRVVLQTMPVSGFASALAPFFNTGSK